jgi:hypothetical protein
MLEHNHREVRFMFNNRTPSVHAATADAGKVRLGGFAPALAMLR